MENKKSYTPLFFKNLGKLFYAIAVADKVVDEKEIIAFKELIKSHWKVIHSIDLDAKQQIIDVFEKLHKEEQQDSDALFLDFIEYKNKESHLFTKAIKSSIMQTCNVIASSFAGRNKSELILLAKLDIELKKNEI